MEPPTVRVLRGGGEGLAASPAESEATENDKQDDDKDDPPGCAHDSS